MGRREYVLDLTFASCRPHHGFFQAACYHSTIVSAVGNNCHSWPTIAQTEHAQSLAAVSRQSSIRVSDLLQSQQGMRGFLRISGPHVLGIVISGLTPHGYLTFGKCQDGTRAVDLSSLRVSSSSSSRGNPTLPEIIPTRTGLALACARCFGLSTLLFAESIETSAADESLAGRQPGHGPGRP